MKVTDDYKNLAILKIIGKKGRKNTFTNSYISKLTLIDRRIIGEVLNGKKEKLSKKNSSRLNGFLKQTMSSKKSSDEYFTSQFQAINMSLEDKKRYEIKKEIKRTSMRDVYTKTIMRYIKKNKVKIQKSINKNELQKTISDLIKDGKSINQIFVR